MKVKELLIKMSGVSSYGIYKSNNEPLNAHPTINEMMQYVDREVKSFDVFIYDDTENGNKVKRIRCCISLVDDELTIPTPLPDNINGLFYKSPQTNIYSDASCPYCGSKHYVLGYGVTTAMYCPPVVKDGKIICEDGNITTHHCTCCECGKEFAINNKGEVSPQADNIKVVTSSQQIKGTIIKQ